MRLKDYLENLEKCDKMFKPSKDGIKYSDGQKESVSIWSNYACKGYVISACKGLLDEETLRKLLSALEWEFDIKTIEEAEQYYIDASYN